MMRRVRGPMDWLPVVLGTMLGLLFGAILYIALVHGGR